MAPAIEPVPEEAVAVTITPAKSSENKTTTTTQHQRQHSEVDIYAPADKYYGAQNLSHRPKRTFTFSTVSSYLLPAPCSS